MSVSELEISTNQGEISLLSVEITMGNNLSIVNGPAWLQDIENKLAEQSLQVTQLYLLREPEDDMKWNKLNVLMQTVPLEHNKFKLAVNASGKESIVSIQKKTKDDRNKWIEKCKQCIATTMLSILSGGLVWLASSSF